MRPVEEVFLDVGDDEGEARHVRTLRDTLTTSVASLYRSCVDKGFGRSDALDFVVLAGAGFRALVALSGVFVALPLGSWAAVNRPCRVVVVVAEHEEGVASALRKTSAGLVVVGGMVECVTACYAIMVVAVHEQLFRYPSRIDCSKLLPVPPRLCSNRSGPSLPLCPKPRSVES